jgi:CelD/BcsL family acetyltransferase involved in cellulose biosynthesis
LIDSMKEAASQTLDSARIGKVEVFACDSFQTASGGADAWNTLVDISSFPNVFRRWEWLSTWWKWFGRNRELHLLRLMRGPRLVGIVPMYLARNRLGAKILSWIGFGGPTCPEYLGPIVDRDWLEPAIDRLTDYLAGDDAWDSIEFPDVAPDDRGTRLLVERLRSTHPAIGTPGVVCRYLLLPDSYESLQGRLSAHARQQVRRHLRKAQSECNMQLVQLDDDKAITSAFETIRTLSISARARVGERSPFAKPEYAGFHREVISQMLKDDCVRVFLLQLNGVSAAFRYAYLYNSKYYSFQTGFDPSLAKYSPGELSLQLVFQYLIDRNVREFDFLRGDHMYKDRFADRERRTETWWVFRSRATTGYIARWLQSNVLSKVRRWGKRWLVR